MFSTYLERCLWVSRNELVEVCLPKVEERERFLSFFSPGHVDPLGIMDQLGELKKKARTWPPKGRYRLLVALFEKSFMRYSGEVLGQIDLALSHLSTQSRPFVLGCLMGVHASLCGGQTETGEEYLDKATSALRFGGDDVQSLRGRVSLVSAHYNRYRIIARWQDTETAEDRLKEAISQAQAAINFYDSTPPLTSEPIRRTHLALSVTNLASLLMTSKQPQEVEALLHAWEPSAVADPDVAASPILPYWQGLRAVVASKYSEAGLLLVEALDRCSRLEDGLICTDTAMMVCSALGDALISSGEYENHKSALERILKEAMKRYDVSMVNIMQRMGQRIRNPQQEGGDQE